MVVIKGHIDPYWHESHLMILILSRAPLRKEVLFEKVREEQKKRTVLGEKEITHSRSAYNYWLNKHLNRWIINKGRDTLELTGLGRWIADSHLGSFFHRDGFLSNFTCPNCSKPADVALLRPLLDTAETNREGRLFMDVDCPRCGYRIKRTGISEAFSKDEFVEFYNKALTELHKTASV